MLWYSEEQQSYPARLKASCACELTSMRWELTFLPFLFQLTLGLGSPAAWHTKETTPPETPIWSEGTLVNRGGAAEDRQRQRKRHYDKPQVEHFATGAHLNSCFQDWRVLDRWGRWTVWVWHRVKTKLDMLYPQTVRQISQDLRLTTDRYIIMVHSSWSCYLKYQRSVRKGYEEDKEAKALQIN